MINAKIIKNLLEQRFREDEIKISGQWSFGYVILIVSDKFSGVREMQRLAQIWNLLREQFEEDDLARIDVVAAYTPEEFSRHFKGDFIPGSDSA